MSSPHLRGRVVLVGGGPGAADLLTRRAWRELTRADVVVIDRLAPREVLADLGPEVDVVEVGKSPYHHPVPQDRINELLVERARAGQHVVRLKGGDPFLFGRGAEEVLACRAAGVDVEVVPGVSSALAAPAAADIPVTHRGTATGVVTVSGHDGVDTDALAAWPGTIVVLMGMGRLDELCAGLRRSGAADETPAAVVHAAWTDDERAVRGTLATLPARVRAANVGNPAVIVIGEVVDVLTRPPLCADAREALAGVLR